MATTDHEKKTWEASAESAFAAGVTFGAGYPERAAIPARYEREAYLAWRERWAGRPHEDQDEPTDEVVGRQAATYAAMAKQTLGEPFENEIGGY